MLRPGAGEIDGCCARVPIDAHGDPKRRSVVHHIVERTVVEMLDCTTDALLAVLHDVRHVRRDDLGAVARDHLVQLPHSAGVGGDLRLDVGDICIRAACRILRARQEVAKLRLMEDAAFDEQEIIDHDALLNEPRRIRGRRTRRQTPDIGVMPAIAHKEQNFAARTVEHRRHDRQIRQVCAAVEGIIQHDGISRSQCVAPAAYHGLHALPHRPEMNRHVRRIRNERSPAIEDRAGEVEPLTHVDAGGGVLQHGPHLLGDIHEEIVEELKQHRVGGIRVDLAALRLNARTLQHEVP